MKQLPEAAAAGQSGTAAQVTKVLEHKLLVLDFCATHHVPFLDLTSPLF